MCQINAVFPKRETVIYGDMEYHPKALVVSFGKNGETINTARIISPVCNSVVEVRVEEIKEKI